LKELGISHLDTGARYPPLNPGMPEQLIGQATEPSNRFIIHTKVYTNTATDGRGDLSRGPMKDSVHTLYAHRANPATPLERQIRNFNEQIQQDHCNSGVSNTPVAVLRDILELCEQNGWKKPTCYRGNYNLITREMEKTLLPLLRAHGMRYNGYGCAHAADFLTTKLVNNQYADTRFDEANPLGELIQRQFANETLQNAVCNFDKQLKANDLTPVEVAIRWVAHHSALEDDDGIILGVSKVLQVQDTVGFPRKGPLSGAIVSLAENF
ncbi:NADP-dependent oxidoreductase domain-containing protein, partial [Clohesyomyces aquaticus]